jgi:hypothetical protein
VDSVSDAVVIGNQKTIEIASQLTNFSDQLAKAGDKFKL